MTDTMERTLTVGEVNTMASIERWLAEHPCGKCEYNLTVMLEAGECTQCGREPDDRGFEVYDMGQAKAYGLYCPECLEQSP